MGKRHLEYLFPQREEALLWEVVRMISIFVVVMLE